MLNGDQLIPNHGENANLYHARSHCVLRLIHRRPVQLANYSKHRPTNNVLANLTFELVIQYLLIYYHASYYEIPLNEMVNLIL